VIMRMSIQRDLADRLTNRNSALCRAPTSLIATEPQTRVTLPLRRSQFRWRIENLPGPGDRHCAVFEDLASSLHSVLEGAHAVNSTSHSAASAPFSMPPYTQSAKFLPASGSCPDARAMTAFLRSLLRLPARFLRAVSAFDPGAQVRALEVLTRGMPHE
jgi:hypothetical protein